MDTEINNNDELRTVVREDEARKATGLKRSQFWELVNAQVLPQPFKPHENSRVNLWFKDELLAYQRDRAAQRNLKGPAGPAVREKQQAARRG